MRKYFLILSTLTFSTVFTTAQEIIKPNVKTKTSFAIVVDNLTYQQTKEEIKAYQKSIEKDGLGTYIIQHNWKNPDEIKSILFQLYQDKKQPLEGAVFVGNIPIAMVRGGQVMTSAFKYPESSKWENSSVASDRFYDDFDLKFDYLKQDEYKDRQNIHYYQFKADSPHYIEMDIYTGRIKPAVTGEVDNSVEQIKSYLTKLVKIREENNPLNHLIASTGHGYNSNSSISWGNELLAFRTSFPKLFQQGNTIKFLNYRNSTFLKNNLLTELYRDNLDFAYMTGHGTVDLQLLNGYPDTSSPQLSMVNVGRYIRSKMRNAKDAGRDLEKTKTDFQNSLGLNDIWFDDAFDANTINEDSIFNQNMDIHAEDLKGVNVRVAYLNSCLTGSFHKKNYIAASYPFSEGKNIVAFANTVGVLQDLWGTQLLGILQHGARTGHLLKKTAFLETHILGDPTYHFTASTAKEYNSLFSKQKTSSKEWKNLLKVNDADLQSYAITELAKTEPENVFSKQLVEIFQTSPFDNVRTQAYYQLRTYNNEDFIAILPLALTDNNEYIKRKALYDISDIDGNRYLEELINAYINDQELARIQYRINWNFQFIDHAKAIQLLKEKLEGNNQIYNSNELLAEAVRKLEYEQNKLSRKIVDLTKEGITEKELNSELRTLRLYRYQSMLPYVIAILKDKSKPTSNRVNAAEVISWFGLSTKGNQIIDQLNEIVKTESNEEVIYQINKTKQIMKDASKRQF